MDLIPPELGARIMSAARVRRTPGYSIESGQSALDGAQVYEELTDIVYGVFRELPEQAWAQRVRPYHWSVHDLLSHLLAVERYTAAQLGVPGMDGFRRPEDDDHHTFAEATIAAQRLRLPVETLGDWWDVVGGVRDIAQPWWLSNRRVAFHGLAVDAAELLVIRGFELWIHAEDVSRAAHAPPAIPSAAAVRSMADLSITTLVPLALAAVPTEAAPEARIVLTGAGGGTWRLNPGDGPAATLLVMDVIDYCRYAARRCHRADLSVEIEGDVPLAENVLAASRYLAV